MKTTSAVILLSILSVGSIAHAQTYIERAPNGDRVGSLSREGSRLVERDRNGDATGYFTHQGNTIEHRDIQGRRLGTTEIAR
jgi:hypothetical protein